MISCVWSGFEIIAILPAPYSPHFVVLLFLPSSLAAVVKSTATVLRASCNLPPAPYYNFLYINLIRFPGNSIIHGLRAWFLNFVGICMLLPSSVKESGHVRKIVGSKGWGLNIQLGRWCTSATQTPTSSTDTHTHTHSRWWSVVRSRKLRHSARPSSSSVN